MPRPAPLTVAEETAWRSLARLMLALPRAIDDDMTLRGGISLTNYVVLMRLSEAPGRTLRMGDLADGAVLSASRITRIVASMVDEGLVTRGRADGDARVSLATLTSAGLARLEEAWPAHLAAVRELVVDHLSVSDLADLTRISARLLDVLEAP